MPSTHIHAIGWKGTWHTYRMSGERRKCSAKEREMQPGTRNTSDACWEFSKSCKHLSTPCLNILQEAWPLNVKVKTQINKTTGQFLLQKSILPCLPVHRKLKSSFLNTNWKLFRGKALLHYHNSCSLAIRKQNLHSQNTKHCDEWLKPHYIFGAVVSKVPCSIASARYVHQHEVVRLLAAEPNKGKLCTSKTKYCSKNNFKCGKEKKPTISVQLAAIQISGHRMLWFPESAQASKCRKTAFTALHGTSEMTCGRTSLIRSQLKTFPVDTFNFAGCVESPIGSSTC